jgi:hypothetical protein
MIETERVRADAVSRMTSLSVRKVQELAVAGKLPGAAKLGGVWTFNALRVRAWIRERERVCLEQAGETRNSSTSAATRGGGVSSLPDESIALAYEQLIHGKRRDAQRHGGRSSNASR